MKILLHTCCAPCLLFPFALLRQQGHDLTIFFYNPNIHPFREFQKRRNVLRGFASDNNISLIEESSYGLVEFLKNTDYQKKERCPKCYSMRLERSACAAKTGGFDAFSTTLLYSKYQQHDLIAQQGNLLAGEKGIPFLYHDFRKGWKEGVEASIELNLYRQSYCGCIFSEQERYDKSLKKQNASLRLQKIKTV